MSRNRQRRVKTVVVHKRPPKTALEQKVEALEQKLAGMEAVLNNVRSAVGKDLSSVRDQFEIHASSIDQLDNNVLCAVSVLREVFGQLSQIDEVLKKSEISMDVDIEAIKEKASKWFADVVASGFKKVAEDKRKVAEIAKAREAAAKAASEALAKEEADKTKMVTQEKTEQAAAESELKAAESPSFSAPTTVGAGGEYPEGAQIFGG